MLPNFISENTFLSDETRPIRIESHDWFASRWLKNPNTSTSHYTGRTQEERTLKIPVEITQLIVYQLSDPSYDYVRDQLAIRLEEWSKARLRFCDAAESLNLHAKWLEESLAMIVTREDASMHPRVRGIQASRILDRPMRTSMLLTHLEQNHINGGKPLSPKAMEKIEENFRDWKTALEEFEFVSQNTRSHDEGLKNYVKGIKEDLARANAA